MLSEEAFVRHRKMSSTALLLKKKPKMPKPLHTTTYEETETQDSRGKMTEASMASFHAGNHGELRDPETAEDG